VPAPAVSATTSVSAASTSASSSSSSSHAASTTLPAVGSAPVACEECDPDQVMRSLGLILNPADEAEVMLAETGRPLGRMKFIASSFKTTCKVHKKCIFWTNYSEIDNRPRTLILAEHFKWIASGPSVGYVTHQKEADDIKKKYGVRTRSRKDE